MKKILTAASAALISLMLSIPVFAGQWISTDDGHWQYRFNDGSYASEWQWIDGNNDGISECYYFDENEILWTNCTAPDGSVVNPDGCWLKDGMVVAMQDGQYIYYPDPYASSETESIVSGDPEPSEEPVSAPLSQDLSPLSGLWEFDYVYDSAAEKYISAASFDRSLSITVHEQSITREFGGEIYEHDLFDVTDLYSAHGGNMENVTAVYSDGIFIYQLLTNGFLLLIDDDEDLLFVLKRG